jgi:hypothetical protein
VLAGFALALGCAPRTDNAPKGAAGAANGAAAGGTSVAGTGSGASAGTSSSAGGSTGGGVAGTASGGSSAGTAAEVGGSGSGGAGDGGSTTVGGRGGSSGASSSGNAGEGGSDGLPDGGTPAGTPTLFFLDVGGRVMQAGADGRFSATTLVPNAGTGPDGIAVDLENGFIYWTNMGVPANDDGYVRRAKLDGSDVSTIVPAGVTYTPKQLRLDAAGGKLYWSDREGMRVQRSNVDGSNVETLLTVATGATARTDASNWCVGVALDLTGGYFYWSQKGPDNGMEGSLRRAHIAMPIGETAETRSDVEVLFEGLPEPVDIDVDVENGFIYWTDRGDDTVNRAPIEIPSGSTAANRDDREILVRNVGEAIGVDLDPARGRFFYTSATGQLGRAALDGTDAVELTGDLGGLTGIAVVDLP